MRFVTGFSLLLTANATSQQNSNSNSNFNSKSVSSLTLTCTSGTTKMLLMKGGNSDDIDWRYFLAGGICAATSHGITTPIDVVKTMMQTNPEKYNKGVLQAARDIVKSEGAGFLLAGLAPTVVGYGFEGALKFGFYETFKRLLKNATRHQFTNFLLASVIAGAVASVVLCPMEEARIKMVGDPTWAKENLVTSIARLVKEGGLFSTFNGLPAMLAKQVPYTMGKQVSFDFFSSNLRTLSLTLLSPDQLKSFDLKWVISVSAAFFASIIACLSSQPGDMILTRSYRGTADESLPQIISSIYRSHGLGGFYLGLQARLAHVASIITSQLVLYDIIKLLLGLPITGSH